MSIVLEDREYQNQAVAHSLAFLTQKKQRNGIVIIPCGGGKSLIAARIMLGLLELGRVPLLFQPRKELLKQNLEKLRMYGFEPAVFSASMGRREIGDLTLATIKSVIKSPEYFQDVTDVLIDECSDVNAKQGQYKDFFSALPAHVRYLGLDATPFRMATNSFGTELRFLTRTIPRVFNEVVYYVQLQDLFDRGYLARPEYFTMEKEIAFDERQLELNSSGSDHTDESVQQHMFKIGFQEKLVDVTQRLIAKKRRGVLVFTRFAREAYALANEIPGVGVVTTKTPDDEREAIVADFRAGKLKAAVNVGVLCLDSETEILTDTGWVSKDAMTYQHNIANWSTNGAIVFAPARFIVRRPRDANERMVIAKGQAKDVRVTADHNMVVGKSFGRKRTIRWNTEPAINIVGRNAYFPVSGNAAPAIFLPEMKSLTPKQVRRREVALAYSYRARGSSYDASNKEAALTVARNLRFRPKTPNEMTLDDCAFVGFWLGDGHLGNAKDGGHICTLAQSTAYPLIVRWIDSLLRRLGFGFSRRREPATSTVKNEWVRWAINRGTGSRQQSRFSGYYLVEPFLNKHGSQLFWGFEDEQFAALLYGFWMADGNHGDGETPSERGLSITGTQKPLYDLLQAVGVSRGYAMTVTRQGPPRMPHWKQQYALHWRKASHRQFLRERLQVEDGWKSEDVWCVTSDTGYIITRRNGQVIVTGNSVGFDYPELDTCVLARHTLSLRVFYQQIGRILRPHPSKKAPWVIDLVGNLKRFGRIEDLRLYCEGDTKWSFWGKPKGKEVQLTNVPLAGTGGNRMVCKQCMAPVFYMRHAVTGNSATLCKPAFGARPNIALKKVGEKTVYVIVPAGSPEAEFIAHRAICSQLKAARHKDAA